MIKFSMDLKVSPVIRAGSAILNLSLDCLSSYWRVMVLYGCHGLKLAVPYCKLICHQFLSMAHIQRCKMKLGIQKV